jgi:gamma-glutamyltranspeptidase/glutathione hydrolase
LQKYKKYRLLFIISIISFSTALFAESGKSIIVDSAVVVCSERLAAEAGVKILKSGGNAIDALTTVAFLLAVTYPRAGNIGGGGFMVFRKSNGQVITLDFRETAPLSATQDMFLDEQGNPIEDRSLIGALAVGVPGTVRGLFYAQKEYGNLSWNEVLQPAIQIARNGFLVQKYLLNSLEVKEKNLRKFVETRRIFFPNGELPKEGETFYQPELANTLEEISLHGDSVFYEGEIADKIIATVQKHGGIISKKDFINYKVIPREPVEIYYRDYTIYSMPPPSSGGLVLKGIFNTLQQIDLANKYNHLSAEYIAFITEIEKQWYANRNLYLGDPDFVEIPIEIFSSPEKAKNILNTVSISHPFPSNEMSEFYQIIKEEDETTHISILDADGNAAAMTYTLNGSFGSSLVADGTGILLNNEMDDFTVKPGSPNLYGLVQGQANAIEPGKRMLSSMTPTIVEKDGGVVGILGTPGGSQIITSVLQILLDKIDYEMSLDDAMNAGRFHHQWLPDSIYYERSKFSESTLSDLTTRGFNIKGVNEIGDIQAIWKYNSKWNGCSDHNGNGVAVGY